MLLLMCFSYFSMQLVGLLSVLPALGVSVKSVRLVAGRLGFYPRSGHTKDFKICIRNFRARRSAQAKVRRVLWMCCSSCMSLNSVQPFVNDNCHGLPIENGLSVLAPAVPYLYLLLSVLIKTL